MKRKIFQKFLLAFAILCLVSISAFAVTEADCDADRAICQALVQSSYNYCASQCANYYQMCRNYGYPHFYCAEWYTYSCMLPCNNSANQADAVCESEYLECLDEVVYCDNDGICEPPDENGSNCSSDCYCDNDGICEPSHGEGSVVNCNDCVSCQDQCQAILDQCGPAIQNCINNCNGNPMCINTCGVIAYQCQNDYDGCMAYCN